jgi:hypothetical protein
MNFEEDYVDLKSWGGLQLLVCKWTTILLHNSVRSYLLSAATAYNVIHTYAHAMSELTSLSIEAHQLFPSALVALVEVFLYDDSHMRAIIQVPTDWVV